VTPRRARGGRPSRPAAYAGTLAAALLLAGSLAACGGGGGGNNTNGGGSGGSGSASSGTSGTTGGANGSTGGSTGGSPSTIPHPTSTSTVPAADLGPVCAGKVPSGTAVVLRGGALPLPGGTGVSYTDGRGTGKTRIATLTEGLGGGTGDPHARFHIVRTGGRVTVHGHAYVVDQVCTYRVLIRPVAAADRAALATRPASLTAAPTTKAARRAWCFSTVPAVRSAAERQTRSEGTELHVLSTGPLHFTDGVSVAAYGVDPGAGTALVGVQCGDGTPLASYSVRTGDTVEIGGVLFKVARLAKNAVALRRTA
jgi:hypothetical protein